MRAVIQRVSQAKVSIGGAVHGAIERGLLILIGSEDGDGADDAAWLAGKIARLRIFADAAGKMNLDVNQVGGRVLAISQFTLFASTVKGNRPSFLRAQAPAQAEPLYQQFLGLLSAELGTKVERGIFGADMQIELINDGPVTILIDSRQRE
jgi:D-tyrosyl-tRNA(Tyr) deacylase